MKKIILLPKTDTVILFLPEQWVGIPVKCVLTPLTNYFVESEEAIIDSTLIVTYQKQKKKNE
jgi:hypothetical protein